MIRVFVFVFVFVFDWPLIFSLTKFKAYRSNKTLSRRFSDNVSRKLTVCGILININQTLNFLIPIAVGLIIINKWQNCSQFLQFKQIRWQKILLHVFFILTETAWSWLTLNKNLSIFTSCTDEKRRILQLCNSDESEKSLLITLTWKACFKEIYYRVTWGLAFTFADLSSHSFHFKEPSIDIMALDCIDSHKRVLMVY